LARRIDVAVGDRARVVEALDGEPTVTLTLPGLLFTRLCGGRGADPAAVQVQGDPQLGEAVVSHMGFMI